MSEPDTGRGWRVPIRDLVYATIASVDVLLYSRALYRLVAWGGNAHSRWAAGVTYVIGGVGLCVMYALGVLAVIHWASLLRWVGKELAKGEADGD